jgi:hypothetical protein
MLTKTDGQKMVGIFEKIVFQDPNENGSVPSENEALPNLIILSEEEYRAVDDHTKLFEAVLPYVHWHEDHWDACKHNREVARLIGAHNSDMKAKNLRISELEDVNNLANGFHAAYLKRIAELEAQVPRVVKVKDTPFRYVCVCGSTVYEVNVFCPNCGAKLDLTEVEK